MLYKGGAIGVTSATMPTHEAGDYILAFAYNQSNNTIPTIDSGFTPITTGTGGNNSFNCGFKVATSGSDTSGTWVNSTNLEIQVYKSTIGNLSAGAFSVRQNQFGTIIGYSGITLSDPTGNSWVVGFAGHRSNNGALNTPPAGMTNRTYSTVSAARAAGHDTNGVVASWSTTNVDVGGSSSNWSSLVLELVDTPSALTLTSVTDPIRTNAVGTIVCAGAEAQGVNSKVEQILGGVTVELTVLSWTDTLITFECADVEATLLHYTPQSIKVTAHSGANAIIATEVIPAITDQYVNLTSVATEGNVIALPSLEATDQLVGTTHLYQSDVATSTPITYNANATWTVPPTVPDGVYDFYIRAWDNTDSTWGSIGKQTVSFNGGIPVSGGGMISPMISAMIQPMISTIIK